MARSAAAAGVLRQRGVYWADYLLRGRPVLLAIDSRGELVKRVRLECDADEDIAREWLAGLIEHYDPPAPARHLKLVGPDPTTDRAAFRFYIPPKS